VVAQLGATVGHVQDDWIAKHGESASAEGFGVGLGAGMLGSLDKIPYADLITRMAPAIETSGREGPVAGASKFIGENLSGMLPGVFRNIASSSIPWIGDR